MKFSYTARTKEGEIRAGIVEVATQEAATALLQKYGFYITSLVGAEAKPFFARKIKFFERISRKEIVMFSRQLSIMFKAKVPLIEALQTLTNQTENPVFREKIFDITQKVEGGTPLSRALAFYPKIFSPFYISMVKSGEVSGNISQSLDYLAEHLEKEYYLNSKIKGAMAYPAFVIIVLLIIFTIVIFFILPSLIPILKESGEELPLITKVVIGLGEFLRTKGWIFVLLLAVIIISIWRYLKTAEGKKIFDRILLRSPVFGSFSKMLNLTRFAENLSTLIAGGLPIAEALGITGEIVGNTIYKEIILEAQTEVRKGESISSVLTKFPEEISPMFVQMTVVGERTGRLDSALTNIVEFYQREVEIGIDKILSLIEPILIVILGLGVGGFIASVLLPLYKMAAI